MEPRNLPNTISADETGEVARSSIVRWRNSSENTRIDTAGSTITSTVAQFP